MSLTLSSVNPDYSSLLTQLQIYLRQKATWLDTVDAGAGQTILEAVAAIGEFNQLGIELAYREAFLETANRESSVYAITRMLGVRIKRKTPASVSVVLTRETSANSLSLKAYQQFDINGTKFFNREPLVFPSGSSLLNCVLYQGEVQKFTVPSNATQFREIYIPEENFVTSDLDVLVEIVNASTGTIETWSNTYEGIWSADAEDKVFYDTTSAKGSAIIMMGDGVHGALPQVGTRIDITYVLTKGSLGNNSVLNQNIKCLTSSEKIEGSTNGPVGGGDDEKDHVFYKSQAPYIYRAKKRAVSKKDYEVITLDYPNVAAAVVHAQKDLYPNDLRWMNLVRICVLPKDSDYFSDVQWTDFLEYFERYNFSIDIQKYNPTKIDVDITAKIAMYPSQLESVVREECTRAITNIFAKKNALGKRKAKSDITDACKATGKVDYVEITSHSGDLVAPTKYSWFNLRNLELQVFYSER